MFMQTTKYKLILLAFVVFNILVIASFASPMPAFAANDAQKVCDKDKDGPYKNPDMIDACKKGYAGGQNSAKLDSVCGGLDGAKDDACIYGYGKGACSIDNPGQKQLNNCLEANPIIKDINLIVNFLSASAGLVITGSIIYGGMQYSWAGNNPNQISAAKDRIRDSLIALIAFFFIFAFLQWLIPGSLLFN
jgi:hypothetical protein